MKNFIPNILSFINESNMEISQLIIIIIFLLTKKWRTCGVALIAVYWLFNDIPIQFYYHILNIIILIYAFCKIDTPSDKKNLTNKDEIDDMSKYID